MRTAEGEVPALPAALQRARQDFLDTLAVERGLSSNTLQAYGRDVTDHLRFLVTSGLTGLRQVEEVHLLLYLGALRRAGLAPSSVMRRLSAVRAFYRHLVREEVLRARSDGESSDDAAPAASALGAEHRGSGAAAGPAGSRDVRGACATGALLELLYATGLRVSELCSLRRGDLHLDLGLVRCVGKGRKERIVPVGEPACAAVRAYLAARREAAPALFLGNKGQPLTRVSVWRLISRVRAAGGDTFRGIAAHAAPFLRDALAGRRRGPARDSGTARAREHRDDADLHARLGGHACGKFIGPIIQGREISNLRIQDLKSECEEVWKI